MSAFSVSDLLNPTPLLNPESPRVGNVNMEEEPSSTIAGDMFAPELFQTDGLDDEPSIFEQQGMFPLEQSSSPEFMRKDSVTTDMLNGMDTIMEDSITGSADAADAADPSDKKERSTKQRDSDKAKDTKHSSKNEGQHTDRRYLCYICHKLFTRRRSVRDHLNKIHGEKTWEPSRSLEVVVEPHTGEPLIPLEELISRGPPPPSPTSLNPSKSPDSGLVSKEVVSNKDEQKQQEQQSINTVTATATATVTEAQEKVELPQPATTIDAPPPSIPDPDEVAPKPKHEEIVPEVEPKAVTAPVKLKKEEVQRSDSRPTSVEPSATAPPPIIGKKRPLPMAKKGTAKVKSSTPSKRIKLTDSERSTPARSPSVTPALKPGSKLKKPTNIASPASRASSRQPSPSPTASAASAASDDDDDDEGVFCICRRGDNHTWMICCDGPCQEWFHGKCVGVKEKDGQLIDKYICPHCTKDGYITTWLRMCRRLECRRPAKVKEDPPSKYCSVECGRMFFVELIKRGDSDVQTSKDGQFVVDRTKDKKMRHRIRREKLPHVDKSGTGTPLMGGSRPHTPAYSEDDRSEYETDSSLDDEELPNRGSALRAGEVKALLQQCKTVEAWRELGKKPETPPRELDEKEQTKLVYDEYETARVAEIKRSLTKLEEKLANLTAREKMLDMLKQRSATIAEEVKKANPKIKTACGYDPRVAWCEEEFLEWYRGEGKDVLESGKIGPPPDSDMTSETNSEAEEKAATMKGGVCIRNNCIKHGRAWQKQQYAELRFEQDLIKKKQDLLAQQEHDIRSRAQIRALEQQPIQV